MCNIRLFRSSSAYRYDSNVLRFVFMVYILWILNANYLFKSKIYAVNMKEELCSIIDWISICNKQKIFWIVLVFRKAVINGLACILCVTVGIDSIRRNDYCIRIRSEENILILASDFDIGFITR